MPAVATNRSLRFLDPRVLLRIGNLQLAARTVVDGFLAGLHRSPKHGASPNFSEYRAYTPGDDPRSIDWHVFARTDRFMTKKFEAETNARVLIALDMSKSMGYQSSGAGISKLEYASMLAASLAYFALHQRDLAGLALFDTDLTNLVPARSRRGQMAHILASLDGIQPGQPTDIARSLESISGFVRQRSIVAVISDFYDDPAVIARALGRLQLSRNDLMIFHILDPMERRPQLRDVSLVEDMETGSRLEVAPSYVRGEYMKLMDSHLRALEEKCRDNRMDYRVMLTSDPLDEALFAYLSLRERAGAAAGARRK